MFYSEVSAEELIQGIIGETDVELPIPMESWVLWLNELEQMLYSEIIREQKRAELTPDSAEEIIPGNFPIEQDQSPVQAYDICQVFADRRQLIKSSVTDGLIFPDTWYIDGDKVRCHLPLIEPEKLYVIYNIRPAIKKVASLSGQMIRIPYQFLDMVRARLRGEAYKLANEDVLAAKWLNDYNVLLENFKVYIQDRQWNFGE